MRLESRDGVQPLWDKDVGLEHRAPDGDITERYNMLGWHDLMHVVVHRVEDRLMRIRRELAAPIKCLQTLPDRDAPRLHEIVEVKVAGEMIRALDETVRDASGHPLYL